MGFSMTETKDLPKGYNRASKTLVCGKCEAEGLNINILVIPLTFDDTTKQPLTVLLLCKKNGCFNKQELAYSDYLKIVGLKPV